MLKTNGDAGYLDGVVSIEPLSVDKGVKIFENATSQEKVLISLMLHGGLWPSHIVDLKTENFDLVTGWVTTPDGKRPLPEITRRYLFNWLQELNAFTFQFSDIWKDTGTIKRALSSLGRRIGLNLNVDVLFETLARALFAISDEGQVIQNVLGDEANLVRVPLHALFPFSISDFNGQESEQSGERAHSVLNRAAEYMTK
jgi:hypothetical protein